MIVRNEEANLAECLSGVGGLFEEMVVVDTGSTDATKAIAGRFGARVIDFPWVDDFAAARNESRRHATCEWIMWLDADDRIDAVNRRRLECVLQCLGSFDTRQSRVFMMPCLSPRPGGGTDLISQARLFARESNLRWFGAVHERIDSVADGDTIELHATDVQIRHLGYSDAAEAARKEFRDLRLLERQYLIDPDDPLNLYYLARIHHARGRYADAIRLARRSIRLDPHGTVLCTPQTFLILAESLVASGRLADALAVYDQGIGRYPRDPYMRHKHGCVLAKAGRLAEAESCFRAVLSRESPSISLNSIPVDLQRETSWLMLARVQMMRQHWIDADAVLRRLIQMQPGCVEAWELLAHANLALGRGHEVRGVIQSLSSIAGTELEQLLLQARLAIAEGRLPQARRWVDQAMAAHPGASAPWVVLSDLLYAEGGDRQRCINVHRKALSMYPELVELRRRLELMLQQESRHCGTEDKTATVEPSTANALMA
jgi:tetratricopeptide (TPR) repeat protein